jgi:putative hemin transport protein
MLTKTENTLKLRWEKFKLENPKSRIRDAAKELSTSEAQLLATQVGESVIALEGDLKEILKRIPSLGYVMALTRNDEVVHERKGIYEKVSFTEHAGLVLGADIDLRLFMHSWKYAFAVSEGERKSLQFFDEAGNAVHKIYLAEKSKVEEYEKLVSGFRAAIQDNSLELVPIQKRKEVEKPDQEINILGFQEEWKALKDTHDFFGLLRKFGVSRTQALRLAPKGFATQIPASSVRSMLQKVSEEQLEIMVFVSNPGCIQIHTGPVTSLLAQGPWYNVMDPEFNLHMREDKFHSAWIVKKPTTDGDVNSIEVYNEAGENILLFFGKRKPGIPEKQEWRTLLSTLV